MATSAQQSWKDAAIAKSEAITDGWEVFKIFAGRLAEWVLFGCMIANIIEILPGVNFLPIIANVVMATQIITLDIAGFGLASMAEHARENGHEAAAREASRTAKWLIGIMIVTLVLVTAGILFPLVKPYLGYAEDLLILVRVVMVVIYGHVIHKLRRITAVQTLTRGQAEVIARLHQALEHVTQSTSDAQAKMQEAHQEEIANLHRALQHTTQSCQELQARSLSDAGQWGARIATLETHIATLEASKIATESALISLQEAHKNATENDTKSDTGGDTETATEDATAGATNITLLRTQKRSSARPKSRTTTDNGKAVKAMRYIRRNATIGATELAQKAQISVSYARKLLSENREKSDVVNQ